MSLMGINILTGDLSVGMKTLSNSSWFMPEKGKEINT